MSKGLWSEAQELSKENTDRFNSLPKETREILVVSGIKTRLQHLHFERERLKAAYRKSLLDIAGHEKNLMRELRERCKKPE